MFNKFEKAILDWIIKNTNDNNIVTQIKAASFKKRIWTGVGFFITLDVPKNLPIIEGKNYTDCFPIIISDDIGDIGQGELSITNGYIDEIELVTPGDYFNEIINDFTLTNSHDSRLADLD